MTTTPIIRIADTMDIPAISILAHAVWPDTYTNILSEAQLKYMLDLFYSHQSLQKQFDEGHIFLLLMMNAETVGFASYSHDHEVGIYKVHKLYVHPMLHGKGFGKDMLDKIANDIIHKGGKAMRLNVNRHNRAKSFYEKYGFTIIGEEDIAIGEGYFMNDYVMEKKL
ncbi:MAG: GNAT family N-acetyltransferase [Chitinophagaceae bacterium]|nr:GNAT family N-acetyltransferase [Chitinophagaceae bacterium]